MRLHGMRMQRATPLLHLKFSTCPRFTRMNLVVPTWACAMVGQCACGRVHLRARACEKQDAVIKYGDSLVPEVDESCSVTTADGKKLVAISGVPVND